MSRTAVRKHRTKSTAKEASSAQEPQPLDRSKARVQQPKAQDTASEPPPQHAQVTKERKRANRKRAEIQSPETPVS
ncbi:uncharacterized protein PHACADRAFT_253733 [Phanerochaete carnosa HHB-10118-sp]|uniref:Uncharacterized protein n=1 Tax=Phanerochaete carnosa (strain HHB-10118-sp) TaxID=650164 RepID=K5WBF7_PHACS|nr:uncharacterized protein PHACADRAFT_253733 [Phanerochaete carnosa HHB-10118-sp]EKM56545.1 hypothetical protein PHACADRAFT_253733 [Phanerochaete carnosa HHB-10118-sp]